MISTNPIRGTIALLILLGLPVVSEARLDLFTTIDGVDYRIAGFSNGQVVISADGNEQEIPRDAEWHLTGGILENAGFFDLSPSYSLFRNSDAIIRKNPGEFGVATVTVRSPTPKDSEIYASALVWILGREAVRIVVEPDALQGNDDMGKVRFQVPLNEAEMAGKPAVLFWKDGDFVPSEPRFKGDATENAFRAAILNDVEGLESAIDAKAKLNDAEPKGKWTLAHYAAEAGSTEALEILLRERSQLALAKSNSSATPLEIAASHGRLGCLTVLIDSISKKSALRNAATEALHQTIRKGQVDSLRILLDAGADPKRGQTSGRILIGDAISNDFPKMCDMLIEAGVRPDFQGDEMTDMLLFEAEAGHVDIVRWMVEKGVKVDSDDPENDILINVASRASGELAVVLVDAGIDPDGTNSDGLTALIAAAFAANLDFARILCQSGADLTIATNSGATALHAGARSNSVGIIEMLLERGADPNSRDSNLRTPLDVALLSGSGKAASTLKANGSEASFDSSIGDVLVEQAIKLDLEDVLVSSLEHGWRADSMLAGVWPAIRVAHIFGSKKCEQVLRDAGAILDARSPNPIVSSSELDESPTVTRKIDPKDPRPMGTIHPTQTVIVGFVLDSEGHPQFPVIRDSDNPILSPEALEVIGEWRFKPPRNDGNETAALVDFPITFARIDRQLYEPGELTKVPEVISRKQPVDPSDPVSLLTSSREPKVRTTGYEPRSTRSTGFVIIEFIVLADGSVTGVKPIDWTSRREARDAVSMIKDWKFEPGESRGIPVRVRVRQQINFW